MAVSCKSSCGTQRATQVDTWRILPITAMLHIDNIPLGILITIIQVYVNYWVGLVWTNRFGVHKVYIKCQLQHTYTFTFYIRRLVFAETSFISSWLHIDRSYMQFTSWLHSPVHLYNSKQASFKYTIVLFNNNLPFLKEHIPQWANVFIS